MSEECGVQSAARVTARYWVATCPRPVSLEAEHSVLADRKCGGGGGVAALGPCCSTSGWLPGAVPTLCPVCAGQSGHGVMTHTLFSNVITGCASCRAVPLTTDWLHILIVAPHWIWSAPRYTKLRTQRIEKNRNATKFMRHSALQ